MIKNKKNFNLNIFYKDVNINSAKQKISKF